MIRVVVADDSRIMRLGICAILGNEPDIDVCGVAANGADAVEVSTTQVADVVVLDLAMPILDGVSATALIVAAVPGVHVLVLTGYDDTDHVRGALMAGATGYLIKDCDARGLVEAVHATSRGEPRLSPSVLRSLAS